MILGRIAVGLIILVISTYLIGILIPDLQNDNDCIGLAIFITIVLAIYCAVSGTYLLYLKGLI